MKYVEHTIFLQPIFCYTPHLVNLLQFCQKNVYSPALSVASINPTQAKPKPNTAKPKGEPYPATPNRSKHQLDSNSSNINSALMQSIPMKHTFFFISNRQISLKA
jgi:hypothetical protein